MSTPAKPQDKTKNKQAIASLILGMLSLAFVIFNFAPGLCSALGCVGATAALLSFVAGAQGIRAAGELDGEGHKLAIAGMVTGGIGLLVFVALFVPSFLGPERELERAIATATAARTSMLFSTSTRPGIIDTPQMEALAIATATSALQTLQGDDFTLTYPGDWQTVDIRQQDACKQPGLECLFAITHPSGNGISINLIRYTLDQEASVEEVDEAVWAEVKAGPRDITLESRDVIEVGGQPAIRRVFSAPAPDAPGGRAHMLQISIVKERDFYQFTVWAPSADALERHRAESEEIVASIEFTPFEAFIEVPTEQPSEHIISLGTICDDKGCNGDTQKRAVDGMVMVYVPAGEFEMGSDDDEVNYALQLCNEFSSLSCDRGSFEFAEHPVHTVVLDGFWIDQTEVTNGQYCRCVEAGDCDPPAESSSYTHDPYYSNDVYDDYPVMWVSWYQAADYCAWAGARLPTEAEWEYAARGPQGRVFPWGNEFDEKWLNCGYTVDTTPVGDYPNGVSWCGTLDMAGNVWEWVADWQGGYPSEQQANPRGPSSGEYRVLRGGSWGYAPYDVRSASRYWDFPYNQTCIAGFRCASGS